jgi:hypothetical protein
MTMATKDFIDIYGNTRGNDDFYRFLQNIYRLFPEDRFHVLIQEAVQAHGTDDEAIYRKLQTRLPEIKPFLSELSYAIPSLIKQKKEMTRQTMQLLGNLNAVEGYMEIGSTGRYISHLRKQIKFTGDCVLLNDVAPSNSPVDIVERGGLGKIGRFVSLRDYDPIDSKEVADSSMGLVTCYIGLHHSSLDKLDHFIASMVKTMRSGAVFILRDHNVNDDYMRALVSLAHAVFNCGFNVPWQTNQQELRHFRSIDAWIDILKRHGLVQKGELLLQDYDPTHNVLLAFAKE